MVFDRFRPTSHFIPPHSWSNDPCGAVYVPETQEYILCYQWNPGTTEGGNSAWGLARSKDLVTWEDCSPAIQNGITTSYDSHGVFSGCIVSRLVEGKRILFLFYTSVSALPIHWSKAYIEGCESQSVAFSTDFGGSWHRYENNPLLRAPPKQALTTGWRDPFVARWTSISAMLGLDPSTEYMMLSSGERGRGPQLHLYQSSNLLTWMPVSTILDVNVGSQISPTSTLRFGINFECASFFTFGDRHYIIVGVEEDAQSMRHNKHYPLWLCGSLILENGKPRFNVSSHGLLDHGVLYAPHTFRDAEDRLLQLGWADEAAQPEVVRNQGWAGCLTHPRELYQISKPVTGKAREQHIWDIDERMGMMTTLGIRPAPQLRNLRNNHQYFTSLERFKAMHGDNYEIKAKFSCLSGSEKFVFSVREYLNSFETTKIVFDLGGNCIKVDRIHSSIENLGASSPDSGEFNLLPGEDLDIRIFVDHSILEVYANDRFAISSRIYPGQEKSDGASYDFGNFDEGNVTFECWEGLKSAWPGRLAKESLVEEVPHHTDVKELIPKIESVDLMIQPVYV